MSCAGRHQTTAAARKARRARHLLRRLLRAVADVHAVKHRLRSDPGHVVGAHHRRRERGAGAAAQEPQRGLKVADPRILAAVVLGELVRAAHVDAQADAALRDPPAPEGRRPQLEGEARRREVAVGL